MDLREAVENRDIPLDAVWEDATTDGPDAGGEPAEAQADGGREADREAFVEELWDREFSTDPSGEVRDVVDRAFDALATEDWDEAAEILQEAFESPCELEEPPLEGDQQTVACHLFDDHAG